MHAIPPACEALEVCPVMRWFGKEAMRPMSSPTPGPFGVHRCLSTHAWEYKR